MKGQKKYNSGLTKAFLVKMFTFFVLRPKMEKKQKKCRAKRHVIRRDTDRIGIQILFML